MSRLTPLFLVEIEIRVLCRLHVVCLKRAMASIRLFCSSATRLKVSNAAKVLDKIMHGGSKR